MWKPIISGRNQHPWIIGILAGLTILLNHEALNGFWRWDDILILQHALTYPGLDYFYDPQAYQQLSYSHLTPWVSLSFALDLWLFGDNPAGFYWHHLLAVFAVAGASYFFLLLLFRHSSETNSNNKRADQYWKTGSCWAAFAAIGFLVGLTVVVMAQQLTTRHYIEGLLFVILAMYFYVLAFRQQRIFYAIISAVFYCLAVTAKEIFVPLIGILPFLQPLNFSLESLKKHLKLLIPAIVVAVLYIAWRWYMLGALVGGYTGGLLSANTHGNLVDLLIQLPSHLFGNDVPAYLCMLVVLLLFIWGLVKRHISIPMLVMVCICLLLPLLPVLGRINLEHLRYLIMPWWVMICVISYLLMKAFNSQRLGSTLWFRISISLLMLLVLGNFIQLITTNKSDLMAIAREFDEQSRFFWYEDNRKGVIPYGHFIYLGNYKQVKRLSGLQKHRTDPVIVLDEIYLNEQAENTELYQYNPACQCMKKISTEMADLKQQWQNKVQQQPLSVFLDNRDGVVHWQFGPYKKGRYTLLNPDIGRLPIGASGQRRIQLTEFQFYLRYDSPEGWITYSPLMEYSSNQESVQWQRS